MAKKRRANQKPISDESVIGVQTPSKVCTPQPLRALTEAQGHYILAIKSATLTFGIGPAGTGKTLIPIALACDAYQSHNIQRLILTRPVVETGHGLGFLPGLLSEKYEPYMAPMRELFERRLGKSAFEYGLKCGHIRAMPLEFMRGITFDDCWVILDEAQNVTRDQMLMFLTRIGRNCKVIITGDPQQCDLKTNQMSGLMDAVERCATIPEVRVIEFTSEDIVRSGLVKDILIAYSR